MFTVDIGITWVCLCTCNYDLFTIYLRIINVIGNYHVKGTQHYNRTNYRPA